MQRTRRRPVVPAEYRHLTSEQIMARIQAGWTEDERLRRMRGGLVKEQTPRAKPHGNRWTDPAEDDRPVHVMTVRFVPSDYDTDDNPWGDLATRWLEESRSDVDPFWAGPDGPQSLD